MMTELVNIRDHVDDVIIDLRYGTENNFTGQVIYDFSDALLRKGTALRLRRASLYLSELGYRLKIWDAYRPVSAQLRLWEVYPDPRFVADPINGYSNHSRGSAVDLTLTDKDGNELKRDVITTEYRMIIGKYRVGTLASDGTVFYMDPNTGEVSPPAGYNPPPSSSSSESSEG